MFRSKLFHVEPALDPWYVTGFCEREASFTYSRNAGAVNLYFAIKLSATDLSILQRIQRFFGDIGRIYSVRPETPHGKAGYTKAASYFRVNRPPQLIRVVEHFERYPLLGTKGASFATWREMVALKQIFRKPPLLQLEQLANQLTEANPRNQPWKP